MKSKSEIEKLAEEHADEYYDRSNEGIIDMPESAAWENRKYNFIDGYNACALQFASQPPAPVGKLWEEVDAVKEPPVEDGFYPTFKTNGRKDVTEFSRRKWYSLIPVVSYLRPVTSSLHGGYDFDSLRDNLLSILNKCEHTAHRSVGEGCNFTSYILPSEYNLIITKFIQHLKNK